jgi:hypothetical protein
MRIESGLAAAVLVFTAAACAGSDAANNPPIMRAVDGIPGWTRTGGVETFTKDGLYGHIDGGAEIVLQYGFRKLAVFKFRPEAAPAVPAEPTEPKEVGLEIYRMTSAESAFGFYSTRVEGGETRWPGIGPDHWISPGQANLVKGEFVVNLLAPDCTEAEIGAFAAALEPKIPGTRTVRPRGMEWLPREGMVPGSARYIKGPLAAQNESPFLDAEFWGFGGESGRAAEAFSARYGEAPAVSKLVVVKFGKAPGPATLESDVEAVFKELLKDVRRENGILEGRNAIGRWFQFAANGPLAALVLGDPDRDAARARLDSALAAAFASR